MIKRVLLPLLCLLLFALPVPSAQAGGCTFFGVEFGGNAYANFPGSNVLQGSFPLYSDSSCQTVVGNKNYRGGIVLTSSSDTAMSTCRRINDAPISYVSPVDSKTVGSIFQCILGDPDDTTESGTYKYFIGFVFLDSPSSLAQGKAACRREYRPSNSAERYHDAPATFECYYRGTLQSMRRLGLDPGTRGDEGDGGSSPGCGSGIVLPLTDLRLNAFDGMGSGIQFNRLDHCGVGNPSVFDMGFRDAVDIWSHIGSGFSVCFPEIGRIVFLDAATSPRTIVFPEYHYDQGWTCASMTIVGTMVLVNAPPETTAQTDTTEPTTTTTSIRPGTLDSIDDAIDLENCEVTTRVYLRLRATPWGKLLDVIPRDTEVTARARTPSWFNVTYLDQEGWSAAWLADSRGECDWSSADSEAGDT